MEPHIPDELTMVRKRMVLSVKEALESHIGPFVVSGNAIYAMTEFNEPITLTANHENQEYTIKVLFMRNLTYIGEDYENSV